MEDNFSTGRVRGWRVGWGGVGSGNNVSEPWREAPPLTSSCAVGRVVVGFLRGHRLRGWGPVAELEGAEDANA